MADTLTNLRELSVAHFFIQNDLKITPNEFCKNCNRYIGGCKTLRVENIASNSQSFDFSEQIIIQNGFKLGEVIKNNLIGNTNPKIIWSGPDTQSGSAVDLIIDDLCFSLKEESSILENMGLYQILNLITNSQDYKRGLHIFECFSKEELDRWFKITKDLFLRMYTDPIGIQSNCYMSILRFDKTADDLTLFCDKGNVKKELLLSRFSSCTYDRFKNETNSFFREKVFSKWIKEYLSSDKAYLKVKKECALKAGKNLLSIVSKYINTSPDSLKRLFRIEPKEYYYGKTTVKDVELFKVPAQDDFTSNVIISDIDISVPSSQLNLLIKIQNRSNKTEIIFRNEIRYSHGQLNGTPEAKFYIASGDINAIYQQLDSK